MVRIFFEKSFLSGTTDTFRLFCSRDVRPWRNISYQVCFQLFSLPSLLHLSFLLCRNLYYPIIEGITCNLLKENQMELTEQTPTPMKTFYSQRQTILTTSLLNQHRRGRAWLACETIVELVTRLKLTGMDFICRHEILLNSDDELSSHQADAAWQSRIWPNRIGTNDTGTQLYFCTSLVVTVMDERRCRH
jgi:hypothetical protein